jgi:hypothetical protein
MLFLQIIVGLAALSAPPFCARKYTKRGAARPPAPRSFATLLLREKPPVWEKIRESVIASLMVQQCNCRWQCEPKCILG